VEWYFKDVTFVIIANYDAIPPSSE
jgi:hypothetical protein